MQQENRERRSDRITIEPLGKDGDKLMEALGKGHMAALLSQMEILYVFEGKAFDCYIHPLGSEEGRCKRFEKTEQGRAMIKNLATLADQMFEVTYEKHMHQLGVMASAEQAILEFLDAIGQSPAQDFDFMTGETVKQ